MYETPTLIRFGTMSELTQAGCTGAADGLIVNGNAAIGTDPEVVDGTTKICFVTVS